MTSKNGTLFGRKIFSTLDDAVDLISKSSAHPRDQIAKEISRAAMKETKAYDFFWMCREPGKPGEVLYQRGPHPPVREDFYVKPEMPVDAQLGRRPLCRVLRRPFEHFELSETGQVWKDSQPYTPPLNAAGVPILTATETGDDERMKQVVAPLPRLVFAEFDHGPDLGADEDVRHRNHNAQDNHISNLVAVRGENSWPKAIGVRRVDLKTQEITDYPSRNKAAKANQVTNPTIARWCDEGFERHGYRWESLYRPIQASSSSHQTLRGARLASAREPIGCSAVVSSDWCDLRTLGIDDVEIRKRLETTEVVESDGFLWTFSDPLSREFENQDLRVVQPDSDRLERIRQPYVSQDDKPDPLLRRRPCWRTVQSYSSLAVCEDGRLASTDGTKLRKKRIHGERCIWLPRYSTVRKRAEWVPLSELVLSHFAPNSGWRAGDRVSHVDGKPSNDHLWNLRCLGRQFPKSNAVVRYDDDGELERFPSLHAAAVSMGTSVAEIKQLCAQPWPDEAGTRWRFA